MSSPEQQIDSLKAEIARLKREKNAMFMGFFTWTMAIGSLIAWYFDIHHVHAGIFVGVAAAMGGTFGAWLVPAVASLREYISWRRSSDQRMHEAFFKDGKSNS